MSLEKLLKRSLLGLSTLIISCGSESGQEGAGCTSDQECKGDRLCSGGQCVTLEERNQNNNSYTPSNNNSTCQSDCSDDFCKDDGCGGICGSFCDNWGKGVTGICNPSEKHCCYGLACSEKGVCEGEVYPSMISACFPFLKKQAETNILYDNFEDSEPLTVKFSFTSVNICSEENNKSVCFEDDFRIAGENYSNFLKENENQSWEGYSLRFQAKVSAPGNIDTRMYAVAPLLGTAGEVELVEDASHLAEFSEEWHQYEITYEKSSYLYTAYTFQDNQFLGGYYGAIDYNPSDKRMIYPIEIFFRCDAGKCMIDNLTLTGFN